MAYSRETGRIDAETRRNLDALLAGQTRALTLAWVQAFDELIPLFVQALQDVVDAGDGEWPTPAVLARVGRLQAALTQARAQLDHLASQAGITITADLQDVVDLAARAQPRLIASQLPPQAGDQAALAVRFDRAAPAALQAIVERTTQQITAAHWPLSTAATDAMQRELIRGITVGDNPRAAAARMLLRVEHGFNGGLTRALVISRTEMLDAHRQAAAVQQRANPDVLRGWVWLAQCDERTCPSCWALHGTEHPPDEDGPIDHQQGRCSRMPLTRPWSELGFDIPEPPPLYPDAQTAFWRLPAASRLQIMGPARLEALQSGRVAWTDLAARRATNGWRDSFAPTPVRDLIPS